MQEQSTRFASLGLQQKVLGDSCSIIKSVVTFSWMDLGIPSFDKTEGVTSMKILSSVASEKRGSGWRKEGVNWSYAARRAAMFSFHYMIPPLTRTSLWPQKNPPDVNSPGQSMRGGALGWQLAGWDWFQGRKWIIRICPHKGSNPQGLTTCKLPFLGTSSERVEWDA